MTFFGSDIFINAHKPGSHSEVDYEETPSASRSFTMNENDFAILEVTGQSSPIELNLRFVKFDSSDSSNSFAKFGVNILPPLSDLLGSIDFDGDSTVDLITTFSDSTWTFTFQSSVASVKTFNPSTGSLTELSELGDGTFVSTAASTAGAVDFEITLDNGKNFRLRGEGLDDSDSAEAIFQEEFFGQPPPPPPSNKVITSCS